MDEYGYMVNKDRKCPVLIRFKYGAVETFRPNAEGEWVRTPIKDNILNGGGDFVWYDDIPEEEVEYYKDLICKAYKEAGMLK